MYTNAKLMQSLNASKLADLRRSAHPRSAEMRRDAGLRLTRPLARLFSH